MLLQLLLFYVTLLGYTANTKVFLLICCHFFYYLRLLNIFNHILLEEKRNSKCLIFRENKLSDQTRGNFFILDMYLFLLFIKDQLCSYILLDERMLLNIFLHFLLVKLLQDKLTYIYFSFVCLFITIIIWLLFA